MKNQLILLFILLSILYSSKALSQPAVGQAAPPFSDLKMINNGSPKLENKFVFINFWTTLSAPEVRSLSHINTLAERFKSKVVFIAVSDENEEQVRSFLQDKQWYNIYFGLDLDQTFHKNYSVKYIPYYYLISPDKIILDAGNTYELMDYKLDSIITKNDSIRLIKSSKMIASPKVSK